VARVSTRVMGRGEDAPENETDDEARERMRRKIRKGMYNENGVAYAPWVSNQIDEEAIIDDMIRREKGSKAKRTSILDRGEIETSEGMKWRMLGNQVFTVSGTPGTIAPALSSSLSRWSPTTSFHVAPLLLLQVDLAWVTGGESDNRGYIVEKRPSYGGDFQEVASFLEVTQLQSKGAGGGRYVS
jgi:hypothetical protein